MVTLQTRIRKQAWVPTRTPVRTRHGLTYSECGSACVTVAALYVLAPSALLFFLFYPFYRQQ